MTTNLGPIGTAYCCREYTVYVLWPLRKCLYCGQAPTIREVEHDA